MSTINLLPDDYLSKRIQTRCVIASVVAYGAVMAAVVWVWSASATGQEDLYAERAQVRQKFSETRPLIQETGRMEQKRRRLIRKAEDTANLMERVPRSYLLGLVSTLCPENITLFKFDLAVVDPQQFAGRNQSKFDRIMAQRASNGKADQIVQITLSGYAKNTTDVDVATYLLALENSPLIAQADLDSSKDLSETAGIEVREFVFQVYLKPGADVIDLSGAAETSARGRNLTGVSPLLAGWMKD